jgi:hypothetical protein
MTADGGYNDGGALPLIRPRIARECCARQTPARGCRPFGRGSESEPAFIFCIALPRCTFTLADILGICLLGRPAAPAIASPRMLIRKRLASRPSLAERRGAAIWLDERVRPHAGHDSCFVTRSTNAMRMSRRGSLFCRRGCTGHNRTRQIGSRSRRTAAPAREGRAAVTAWAQLIVIDD